MNTWHQLQPVGFDTETTGINPLTDRIVTAAIIAYDEYKTQDKQHTWIINPQIPIPESATAVHGITTEKARAEGKDPVQAIDEIADTLCCYAKEGSPLLAFNASYDFTILRAEIRRYSLPTLEERLAASGSENTLLIIDPLVIDRKITPIRKGKRRLEDLARIYGVNSRDFHNANDDVIVTLELWEAMRQKCPDFLKLDAKKAMRWQQKAHQEWAKNFEKFLHKVGRYNDHVNRNWPYQD